jgi:hypothetical protein
MRTTSKLAAADGAAVPLEAVVGAAVVGPETAIGSAIAADATALSGAGATVGEAAITAAGGDSSGCVPGGRSVRHANPTAAAARRTTPSAP